MSKYTLINESTSKNLMKYHIPSLRSLPRRVGTTDTKNSCKGSAATSSTASMLFIISISWLNPSKQSRELDFPWIYLIGIKKVWYSSYTYLVFLCWPRATSFNLFKQHPKSSSRKVIFQHRIWYLLPKIIVMLKSHLDCRIISSSNKIQSVFIKLHDQDKSLPCYTYIMY